jgi:hypothetical protein
VYDDEPYDDPPGAGPCGDADDDEPTGADAYGDDGGDADDDEPTGADAYGADDDEPTGADAYGDDGGDADAYGDPAPDAYGDPAGDADDESPPGDLCAEVPPGDPDALDEDPPGTSAGIAVTLGSNADADGPGTTEPVIAAMRAIAVIHCVESTGSVGAPIGWTPPAVIPGLAIVIDGDGLADAGTIDDDKSPGIAVAVGSLAPPPAGVGTISGGDPPGDGGVVDATAIAPCCGDSGTGESDGVPNSSPAIRAIAIINWV